MVRTEARGPPAAARPAGRAGSNRVIQAVVGTLSVSAAWFVLPSPPAEPGEIDPASMIYSVASLLAFTLGLLLMFVSTAGIRLPPVFVNCLMWATRAAAIVALLFYPPPFGRQSVGSLEAGQRAQCAIPASGSPLASSGHKFNMSSVL